MDRVHPLIKVGGPILGLLILVYVINAGVDAFRADQKAARDAEREAMLAAAEADQDQEAAVETDSASATGESDSADSEAAPAEVEEPVVYFRQPTTNAIVPPTFKVKMGAEGLVIEPSGEVRAGAGHMHILVDTGFIPPGSVIPSDDQHIHFGDGALEAELSLSPGEHTLYLQFTDGAHTGLEGDQYRDMIIVFVEEDAPAQSVAFFEPLDGATVSSPVQVVMAATGLVVEPSGELNDGAGHFHILVNTDFVPTGEIIPTDEQNRHYGKGQTTASLELPPGEHTLRLQFADGAHTALEGDAYRDTITIIVAEGAQEPSVRFAGLADGATVSSPFEVTMEATGLVVEPSGEINEGAGHFHILVDTPFVDAGAVIPTDEAHLHYGQGQTTASLDLPPGEHTLRLQFADGAHIALEGDAYRDTVTVIVAEGAQTPSVRFAGLTDGAIVTSPFEVGMEATGLVVVPSGEINEGAGHFHILVDTPFVDAGVIIPTDDAHLHYGKGQTTASLNLPPGEHTLRLQFADGAHTALEGEAYRDTVTVIVAEGAQTPSVRFAGLADGDTVTSPFEVGMEATGLIVEPSGEINEGAGHFHILVDTPFVDAGVIIPTDDAHLHYGKGQTTATLELPPGEYTLRLQFADGAHTALEGDAYRDTVTIFVAEGAQTPSVRFAGIADGDTVTSPFEVTMEATGLIVEPSGEINEGAGHFHILVDTPFVDAGVVIPTDEEHLHYGQAQTTATLELPPGEHTLRLQFADGAHIALEGEAYRHEITVSVTAEDGEEADEQSSLDPLPAATRDLAIAAMTETGCNSCHVTPGLPEVDAAMLGPDQTFMGDVAATRREGYTAAEYIRESIVDPSAFVVEECPLGQCLEVMPANYGDLFSEEELNAVVDYLLSLKAEQ